MEDFEVILKGIQVQKAVEIETLYYTRLNGLIWIDVDPTKINPPVNKVAVRGGGNTVGSINMYLPYVAVAGSAGHDRGYLLRVDEDGHEPYILETTEYEKLNQKMAGILCAMFEDYAVKRASVFASRDIEDITKIELKQWQ